MGFFRCCPLRSFPWRSRSSRFATLGRGGSGNSGGITSLPVIPFNPLGHSLIVPSPTPVFGGGGEREIYYYQLLLCTAVTLTIDLIYDFPVTVGRMFTCVLEGFSDLIMLAWAFRAVLFILLGFRV